MLNYLILLKSEWNGHGFNSQKTCFYLLFVAFIQLFYDYLMKSTVPRYHELVLYYILQILIMWNIGMDGIMYVIGITVKRLNY